MIVNSIIDKSEIIELAKIKLQVDRDITEIIKKEHSKFSYKKLIADLGEYHAKRNIEPFFEELKFANTRVEKFDLKGILKEKYAKEWDIIKKVKIEVKTRYWQKNAPHLGNVHASNFDLFVFVSLNEDYSIHYISMTKSSDLSITSKNKVIYTKKIKPLFATSEEFEQHLI